MPSLPVHSPPNSDINESMTVVNNIEEHEEELPFFEKLVSADWERYCFQKDLIRIRPPFCELSTVYKIYRKQYDSFENQSFPIVQARDLYGGVKHYSFDELMQMTQRFQSTLICYTLFGTLHRATIQTESGSRNVLVKTWEFFYPVYSDWQSCHHTHRLYDELNMLRYPEISSHPNVVKLIGFHCERRLAVIYEDRCAELLEKIIPADTFNWDERMKVATDIARMLKAFHDKKLVHGGVYSKCIMVDEKKCPVVFDFELFSYCEDREEYESYLRKHYNLHYKNLDGPPWSMRHDIFGYGILLMELIKKKMYHEFDMPTSAQSAVDDSFRVPQDTAMRFTKLALNCLEINSDEQPTIQCIIGELKELNLCCPPKKRPKSG